MITRYLPKGKKLLTEQSKFLDTMKEMGFVQYSFIPFNIDSSDAQGIFRIDYKDINDLKTQLKENFTVDD